jgi:hypothetical protein
MFVFGLAAGAVAVWLFATGEGKAVCARVRGRGGAQDETVSWQGDGSDADARSEALRQKIEETRRRLREQVGLPPEG